MSIKIIIPSADRAGSVLTNIENQIICVPENQLKDYVKHNTCEIISHPPFKNLAQKRNWIINTFDDVFMVDDDASNFQRIYVNNNRNLTSKETFERIQELYYQAKFIDAKLFGFSEDGNHLHFNPYKPFMLKGMTGGGAYGIMKDSNLFFNEKTTGCDSHFITLLNIYKNRFSLIDTRFYFNFQNTFTGNGGQASKRTLQSEKQDTIYLRKLFGESVQLRDDNKKGAKKNHKYQRKIKSKW
jgi:hypothetical protein